MRIQASIICLFSYQVVAAPFLGNLIGALFGSPQTPAMLPPQRSLYAFPAQTQPGQNGQQPGQQPAQNGQVPIPYGTYQDLMPNRYPVTGFAGALDHLSAGIANFGNSAGRALECKQINLNILSNT